MFGLITGPQTAKMSDHGLKLLKLETPKTVFFLNCLPEIIYYGDRRLTQWVTSSDKKYRPCNYSLHFQWTKAVSAPSFWHVLTCTKLVTTGTTLRLLTALSLACCYHPVSVSLIDNAQSRHGWWMRPSNDHNVFCILIKEQSFKG